jgi:DNA-binding transcriptional LysR family regulator
MNMKHVEYFRTLAKVEHVTKAAELLNISQPSLSNAMRALEEELGTKLFEKRGRNIMLTKYGKLYAKSVESAFDELEHGERTLRKMTGLSTGHIDIAFFHTLGISFIPQLIKRFLKLGQNKDITFSLSQGTEAMIIGGLKRGDYDLGFTSATKTELELDFIPIASEELYVVVPLEHPLAERAEISLQELKRFPIISYSQPGGLRDTINDMLRKVNVEPNIVYEAEQGSAVAGMVAAGFGIAIIPDIPLPPLDIKYLRILEPHAPRYIYMTALKDHYETAAVRNFRNYITEAGNA